ncbi:MAG TPA: hypothetical protein VKA38_14735, partial [Draconibacterium sp.]|nr:hypothetical protein [Draconibacterium sp.]
VLVLVAGFIYFTKNEVNFTKETSVYKAVPVTSPVFAEFSSLKSIPFDNPVLQELIENESTHSFFNRLQQLDTLIENNKEIQNGLRHDPFILAFGFSGKTDLVPLLIKKADNKSKKKALENLLQQLFPVGKYTYDTRDYNGYKITTISSSGETAQPLCYCFSGGLFLASSSAILVEQSIRQLNTYNIVNNPYFLEANKTVTSQSDISWYINHKYFPELVGKWLNGKSTERVNEFGETVRSNYRNMVKGFQHFAAWSELDLEFDDNEISLNGISTADDSLNHFLSVFNGQETVRFEADEVLPKNTSFFCSYSFSNKKKFFNNLEEFYMHSDNYYKREEEIKKIESGAHIDFKTFFRQIVKDEVVVATTTIPVETADKITYFILHTEGHSAAEEQLNALLTNYAQRKNIKVGTLESQYAVDKETRFTLYRFPYPSFPGIWLGKPFTLARANYVAFNGNYMVFSNSKEGLQQYLHNMLLDAALAKDMQYLRFQQNLVNRANINVYVDINRAFGLVNEIFNTDIAKKLKDNEEVLRKFQAVNWQVIHDKEIFFNSLYLLYNQHAKEEAQTTWQSNIGSSIDFKPQMVINHNDPRNREVILQDTKNNLHQITHEGRIRWTVPLPEPILSEIFQIDYFKNGKLQYLSNTKSKLYLIDRDGNNVAHFPVVLRSLATNGMSVFDYDNNHNYRYFVACEDKKVYAYDYTGNVVSGWEFGQTDFPVTTPVQHFRVARKDYIVFKDKSNIYILDRRGRNRVTTAVRFENSRNPLVLNENGMPKIVATDVTGKVYYIFFNGKYTEKKTGKFSSNHFFTCDDLNGNGIPDFVFVDGNELTVMNENGKKLFDEKFRNPVKHRPNIYTFGPKLKKVGIVDSDANRIYLFNPDGKLHDGFPLQGNSEFSIGKISDDSGSLNLIVGSEGSNLFDYTLN